MLKVLDLFSGIGGFSLGLERTGGFKTVAFCEIEEFPRRVLAKHWPGIPIHRDVRELRAEHVGAVDVICGGFPCQDISSSGARAGISGAKSGLWKQYARIIRELRPRWVIVENVADLLHRGLGVVLGDLAEARYDAEWRCIPASFAGLPQTRDRIWIVAYPDSVGRRPGDEWFSRRPEALGWPVDDRLGEAQDRAKESAVRAWRSDDGVSDWMDRMSSLGNAVVPQIPEIIGSAILEAEAMTTDETQRARPEPEGRRELESIERTPTLSNR